MDCIQRIILAQRHALRCRVKLDASQRLVNFKFLWPLANVLFREAETPGFGKFKAGDDG
jgi:hypothetical protein